MVAPAQSTRADPALPAPDAARLNSILTLLNPSLADLAATLQTSPLELADWLATPAIAHHLASLTEASQALENLRIAAARAPALTACQNLLASDNPVERRRVVSTLLRTPIRPVPTASPRPAPSRRLPLPIEPNAQPVSRPSVHDLAMRLQALTQAAIPAPTPAPSPPPHAHDTLGTLGPSPRPVPSAPRPAARPGNHTSPRVAARHTNGTPQSVTPEDPDERSRLPIERPPPDPLSIRRALAPRAARLIAAAGAPSRPP